MKKHNFIMDNISWAFGDKKYKTHSEFSKEVRHEQIEIFKEDTWQPDEVVIVSPKVRIFYRCCSLRVKENSKEIIITSDNNKHFTACELLFKIHNAVLMDLEYDDHKFFEGLDLVENTEIPTYELILGS